ncbi:MAG TPA: hypothetical protein PKB10_09390, partial [Tepidisphaeraceae bacterium]|nr:hypothetical protein [Tepidisphaeraceae bacterium]
MSGQAHWLWRQTAGQRHRYLIAILALLCGALLLYVPPMIIAAAIDYIIAGNQENTPAISKQIIAWMGGRESLATNLWIAGGAVVLITALGGAFMYLKSRQTVLACEIIA